MFLGGKESLTVSPDQRRHSSLCETPPESNVLRKVASLTLDRASLEQKVSRPKFVPEKLDFQIYEKFEGNCYSFFPCIVPIFVLFH